jgi:DNA-binding response OmpR family regulator
MNQTLLIVEDDEATAELLTDNLVADGYRVAVASGAAEGVRQIEVRHPSLVLLDLKLEDGSGLTLLDRVRSADGLASRIDPELPVIVISGRSSEADRVRSFDRGADDHVQKPLAYGELLGSLSGFGRDRLSGFRGLLEPNPCRMGRLGAGCVRGIRMRIRKVSFCFAPMLDFALGKG